MTHFRWLLCIRGRDLECKRQDLRQPHRPSQHTPSRVPEGTE